MSDTETFIELIRDWKQDEALEMLNASPDLAKTHTDRDGQLHGASPLGGQTKPA